MSLTTQLREAIQSHEDSAYRLAINSGVPNPIIHRFMTGERGIAIGSMEKLCDYLGLELTPKKKPRAKPKAKAKPKRKRRGAK
mgnify:CR=1 FL=1